MEVAILIFLILNLFLMGACFWLTARTIKSNFEIQDRMKLYSGFFDIILVRLEEDTAFLRSELMRSFSLELMETKQFNSALIKFQNDVQAIRDALTEYKIIEK